jgi:hypothetical protein
MAQAAAFLTFIQGVPSLNLGLDIDFLSEVLCNVSQPLQENVEVVPVIVP